MNDSPMTLILKQMWIFGKRGKRGAEIGNRKWKIVHGSWEMGMRYSGVGNRDGK